MRGTFILLFFAIGNFAYSQETIKSFDYDATGVPKTDSVISSEIHEIDEVMPQFPGGIQALLKFLAKNVQYPDIAIESEFQGKVIVKFYVDIDGIAKEPSILRNDGCEECGAEVIRVVNTFPKWIPGNQLGKPVKVYYTLPVGFAQNSGVDFNNKEAIFKGDVFKFRSDIVKDISKKGKKKKNNFIQTSFEISAEGIVTNVSIVTSDTDDQAALEKIKQGLLKSNWYPAIKGGKKTASSQTMLFTF